MARTRKIVLKRTKRRQQRRNCNVFIIYLLWTMQQINRDIWVHPLNEERTQKGEFYTHYTDHRLFEDRFFELYHMTVAQFDELLYKVGPVIVKKETNFRRPLSAEERLAITISFLSSGDSFTGLKARFRTGKSTIHDVIVETCEAIWETLKGEVLPDPTPEHWRRIEEGFRIRLHFPNCIGALDGKHIRIKAPGNTASLFHNYKGHFSTVLLALIDANYRFIYVYIGEYGSNADGSVFKASMFGKKYLNNQLSVPGDTFLPNYFSDHPIPHVFVADEAFPLLPVLMRPYPKTHPSTLPKEESVFNYRLSHARIVVENAFGIFTQRWRIFDRTIPLEDVYVDKVVQACICLHNYLVEDKPIAQLYAELNPEQRPFLHGNGKMRRMPRLPGYRSANDAQEVCEIFTDYFNSPQGAVSWQQSRVSYRL